MPSISLPTLAIIAASTAAVAGVATGVEARQQGIAQSKMYREKARVEADNARQQQINMRQNMLRALASQNAQAGVGGVGTGRGTSFGANVQRQIDQAQNDLLVSKANASAQTSLLDQAATNASQSGSIAAVGDVLGAGGSFVNSPGGKYAITGAPV